MRKEYILLAAMCILITSAAKLHSTPSNDNFSAASPITGFSNFVAGSTVNASSELGEGNYLWPQWPSVWWVFRAPTNGTVKIEKNDHLIPDLDACEGNSLSNLSMIYDWRPQACAFSFDVRTDGDYYIRATTPSIPTNFTFKFVFQPGPENDVFAARITLNPMAERVTGTTVGATVEAGEPFFGSNSVWWSWATLTSGPVILTTAGSTFDTSLAVYTGSIVTNLSLIGRNDNAYDWVRNYYGHEWRGDGPPWDPTSRFRLEAVAGTTYQIVVAGGAGEVVLNFEKLAIESVATFDRIVHPDHSVDFTWELLLSNLRATDTGPLRIRLIAQPWYPPLDAVYLRCPVDWPSFDAPNVPLGTFTLPFPGTLASSNSIHFGISETVPPPPLLGQSMVMRSSLSLRNYSVDSGFHGIRVSSHLAIGICFGGEALLAVVVWCV